MHSPESSPGSDRWLSLPRYPTLSRGSSLASEQHLKISPRQSSTASARKRGSSFRRLLLSQTSWTDCSQASERSLSLQPYPMHSPESSPVSERSPRLPRYPTLSRGSSLASERSPSHPRYPMHSPESSPVSERSPSHPRYPTLSRGSSLASEQHLKISPRQSSTASARKRGSSFRRLLLSRTSWTDCSLGSERSPRLPPYQIHSP